MVAVITADPILKQYRQALDAAYGERIERIERVVLFGSRARGEATADSDYARQDRAARRQIRDGEDQAVAGVI